MNISVIQEKLLSYRSETIEEQDNALKEIAQEIALLSLYKANFFNVAAFQGGTALRILYGLDRFSEDLDFLLKKPDKSFDWRKYLESMNDEFKAYGFNLEFKSKEQLDKAVRLTFLKAESEGGLLLLRDIRTNRPKINIKLEVDTNPPADSGYEIKFLDFPLAYDIVSQDMPSLFAGKCHALLSRDYVKGRDWYDFVWYIARATPINFNFFANAIHQAGPWKNIKTEVGKEFLINELTKKVRSIDWDAAKKDVQRFLRKRELISLDVWSKDFFLTRIEKMSNYLSVS